MQGGPARASTDIAIADIGDEVEAIGLPRDAYPLAGVAAENEITVTAAARLPASLAAPGVLHGRGRVGSRHGEVRTPTRLRFHHGRATMWATASSQRPVLNTLTGIPSARAVFSS